MNSEQTRFFPNAVASAHQTVHISHRVLFSQLKCHKISAKLDVGAATYTSSNPPLSSTSVQMARCDHRGRKLCRAGLTGTGGTCPVHGAGPDSACVRDLNTSKWQMVSGAGGSRRSERPMGGGAALA